MAAGINIVTSLYANELLKSNKMVADYVMFVYNQSDPYTTSVNIDIV